MTGGAVIAVAARSGADRPDAPRPEAELSDLRFRSLLTAEAWARLPADVRRRFSKRMTPGDSVVYRGQVVEIEMSRMGRLLAQAARVIGAPLPLHNGPGAAVVSVTEDQIGQGQVWSRLYVRPTGFPQVIHSAKRFAGPTGLEEHLGLGIGMALTLTSDDRGLAFLSDHYFLQLGGLRLRLPDWLSPGHLTVTHEDLGDGRFIFGLDLEHPRLGRLVRQRGVFSDL